MNSQDQMQAIFPRYDEIPAEHRVVEPIHQRCILIGGVLKQWDGEMRTVHSPIFASTTESGVFEQVELGSIPVSGLKEADESLSAAIAAYDRGRGIWPTMAVAERIACIEDFIEQIVFRRDEIVRLIMWEIGKSLSDAAKEFDRTIVYIHETIAALKKLDADNSRLEVADSTIGLIRRAPLGIAICLGPYNYPMNETFTTLIPALIMGNVVLLKLPKFGVLFYSAMLEAFCNAFPAGVINTVYGNAPQVVPHLMASGEINILAFIGSSRVADQLKKAHPKSNRLRAVLGLDAKNAAIILPDADLEHAVRECVAGSLAFNGQRCTAIKMIWVHQSIADIFLRRLSDAVHSLKRGMPWEDKVVITPLPDKEKCAYLTDCIGDAVGQGARIINEGGGTVVETMFYPAVIYPVKAGMRLYREEQFGPVVPVTSFNNIEEPLDYVTTSDYGQQVSVFGTNPQLVATLIDPLVNQVCRVNLNCQCQRGPDVFPFAGRKDSAEGTLSVQDALRAFSIRSMVATKENEANKTLLSAILTSNASSFLTTRVVL